MSELEEYKQAVSQLAKDFIDWEDCVITDEEYNQANYNVQKRHKALEGRLSKVERLEAELERMTKAFKAIKITCKSRGGDDSVYELILKMEDDIKEALELIEENTE